MNHRLPVSHLPSSCTPSTIPFASLLSNISPLSKQDTVSSTRSFSHTSAQPRMQQGP